MSVRARFAPSPTGYLHIGGVRTALFNWLFARNQGGEFLLRIENTDTGREVATATDQIKESMTWLGLDWDGPVTFQLDRQQRCVEEARRLVAEGKAYEDEGAVRIRMPDEGVTAWDDVVRGRVEVPNAEIDHFVAIRADGRPTYNFASPVEDWLDGITHVIRASDHISNTPKQIRILEALGAPVPVYAHVGMVLGPDGKKLSKRHGAEATDEFRAMGYLPEPLVNYLALLGWSFDDRTEIMSREELVERFTLERVGASPAIFDYEKLDHFNGKFIRSLPVDEFAERLVTYLREQGYDWDEQLVRATAPLVQEKIERLEQYPELAQFFFARDGIEVRDPDLLDAGVLSAAEQALAPVEPWRADTIEQALRAMADELGAKPRQAFQPVRVAVTGSRISPGLFESLELLGKERSLDRIRSAAAATA